MVDKQCAQFYSVAITEEHARGGLICRGLSDESEFKLSYFELEEKEGLSSALQEKEILRDVEARLLAKRAELSMFKSEYREVLTQIYRDDKSIYTRNARVKFATTLNLMISKPSPILTTDTIELTPSIPFIYTRHFSLPGQTM